MEAGDYEPRYKQLLTPKTMDPMRPILSLFGTLGHYAGHIRIIIIIHEVSSLIKGLTGSSSAFSTFISLSTSISTSISRSVSTSISHFHIYTYIYFPIYEPTASSGACFSCRFRSFLKPATLISRYLGAEATALVGFLGKS